MKKLLFVLILFLLCITSVNASNNSFYSDKWIDDAYINKVKSGMIYYQKYRFVRRKSDNSIAYCLEPFKSIIENEEYKSYADDHAKRLGISEEVWKKITLIAYYGYGYGNHKEDIWYPITQVMIWREIDKDAKFYFTDTLNGNKTNKYDKKIEEINNLVKNHNKLPSFANKTYTFSIESTNVLTDSNAKLEDFIIESGNEKLTIKKENNKLHIDTTEEISTSIIFRKDFNNYNKTPIIFIDAESQNVMLPGKINSIKFRIDLEVLSGNIEITKEDLDTGLKSPQGEGKLIGTTYGVYDEENNLIDTLIIDETYTAKSKKLKYGKYKIKELKSMEGYYLDNNEYDVEINSENLNQQLQLKNKVIKSKIEIYKYYDDKLEEGVGFEIYNSNGELINTVKTNSEGKIELTLPYGSYLFHQLNSKKNYKRVDDFEVVVDYDSKKVQVLNLYDEKFSSKVKIYKLDSETGEIIKDKVQFRIFDILNNRYIKINEKEVLETHNGVLVLEQLVAGEYYIEEIQSPLGYELNKEKLYFKIDDENNFLYDEKNNPIYEINFINNKEKIVIEVPDTNKEISSKIVLYIEEQKSKHLKKRN